MKRHLLLASTFLLAVGVAIAQFNVLVCGAPPPGLTYNEDVQARLISTALFDNVDVFDIHDSTPTLPQLQAYNAVLVYSDATFQDSITLGNNLAAYVDDGGGVVCTMFTNATGNWPGPITINGAFNSPAYRVIVPDNGASFTTLHRTLGTVPLPLHPIMQSVSSFDGGAASYETISATMTPGSYQVANCDNGDFLIVAKETAGAASNKRRADLNFYPPSSNANDAFWVDSTDGARIMANALLWVAGSGSTAGEVELSNNERLSIFPNPANAGTQVSITSSEPGVHYVELFDAVGNMMRAAEPLLRASGVQRASLDVHGYAEGVYFVRVFSVNGSWTSRMVVER